MADYNELFRTDSLDKQIRITSESGIVITNTELHGDEFELTESLCSEQQLKFGACESSGIKFKISYTESSLHDQWLTVETSIDGNEPYRIGRYKVASDKPTSDRRYRDIVAYDAMHDILTTDIAEWYNTIFPGDNTRVKVKELRDSFFQYVGVTQETVTLPQDDLYLQKTVDPIELAGSYIITALCELNGCFGHIGRDGIFHYVFLEEMTEQSGFIEIEKPYQISSSYEDYVVQPIDSIKIRQDANDEGFIYGVGDNQYLIEDNMLIYGYSDSELTTLASNLMNAIGGIYYRPANVRTKGNLTLPVGQGIKVVTTYKTIYTYILERSFKGVQALFDEFTANGSGENYDNNLNSSDKQLIQLKGLINQVDNSAFHFNVVQNGKAVNVGDGQTSRIIRANIITKANAQVKVEIEIQLDVTLSELQDVAVGTISYVLDNTELSRHPIETWIEGDHVLALQNFMNIQQSGFHIFDVFLNMSGGSAYIDKLGVLEIFTGTNIVENPGFTGLLEIEEEAPTFTIPQVRFANDAIDDVVINLQAPEIISISDTSSAFTIPQVTLDRNVTENIRLVRQLNQSARVTEDGVVRVTENEDVRYTEAEKEEE